MFVFEGVLVWFSFVGFFCFLGFFVGWGLGFFCFVFFFKLKSFPLEFPPWLGEQEGGCRGRAGKTEQIPKRQLLWAGVWCWGCQGSEARPGSAEAAQGIRLIPAPREVPGYTAGCGA